MLRKHLDAHEFAYFTDTKVRGKFSLPKDLHPILAGNDQCFFSSRSIGEVTLKINYFYHLVKYFLDQSIQKILHLNLKTEALATALSTTCVTTVRTSVYVDL